MKALIKNNLWNRGVYQSQFLALAEDLPIEQKRNLYQKIKRKDQIVGLVRNQTAGISVKLETLDHEVLTLVLQDISRIENV